MGERIVMHVDMDAFFAAVEEHDKPWLRGKPVVVGADPKNGKGRGVVSTANYEARKYGVGSAMPISKAWQLCKMGEEKGGKACMFVSTNFSNYGAVSARIMAILRSYANEFEQVSVDEAYLTPKSLNPKAEIRNYEEAKFIAKRVKKEIMKREHLTCSIGIGPNKLVAKIASEFQKPDGLTVVQQEKVQNFLDPLPVRVIPGIGPKSEAILINGGMNTICDLHTLPRAKLVTLFGVWGEEMYARARGEDESPLEETHEVKSIGRQETLEEDTRNATILVPLLRALCTQVAKDAILEQVRFKTIEVTIRFADFETHSSQTSLPSYTQSESALSRAALKLFLPYLDSRANPRHKKIRLLGLRVSFLSSLF